MIVVANKKKTPIWHLIDMTEKENPLNKIL